MIAQPKSRLENLDLVMANEEEAITVLTAQIARLQGYNNPCVDQARSLIRDIKLILEKLVCCEFTLSLASKETWSKSLVDYLWKTAAISPGRYKNQQTGTWEHEAIDSYTELVDLVQRLEGEIYANYEC